MPLSPLGRMLFIALLAPSHRALGKSQFTGCYTPNLSVPYCQAKMTSSEFELLNQRRVMTHTTAYSALRRFFVDSSPALFTEALLVRNIYKLFSSDGLLCASGSEPISSECLQVKCLQVNVYWEASFS